MKKFFSAIYFGVLFIIFSGTAFATDSFNKDEENAFPVVTMSVSVDTSDFFPCPYLYCIKELVDSTDTNVYVNKVENDIVVKVRDFADKMDSVFNFKLKLDSLNVPKAVYDTLALIYNAGLVLNSFPTGDVVSEVVNDSMTRFSYTETVGGIDVSVSYMKNQMGSVVERPVDETQNTDSRNSKKIKVLTVTYKTFVNGDSVAVSCYFNAETGEKLVKDGKNRLRTLASSKKEKSSYDGYNVGPYFVTYKQRKNPQVAISYVVDESGAFVKHSDEIKNCSLCYFFSSADYGYEITYTYVNRFNNIAEKSVFVVLDQNVPKVKILSPLNDEVVHSNEISVKWTVNGALWDSLAREGFGRGAHTVVRYVRDKAGNGSVDSVVVIGKGDVRNYADPSFRIKQTSDFQFSIVIDDAVEDCYSEGHRCLNKYKYNVWNTYGQLILRGEIGSSETLIPTLPSGAYVVKVGYGARRVNVK